MPGDSDKMAGGTANEGSGVDAAAFAASMRDKPQVALAVLLELAAADIYPSQAGFSREALARVADGAMRGITTSSEQERVGRMVSTMTWRVLGGPPQDAAGWREGLESSGLAGTPEKPSHFAQNHRRVGMDGGGGATEREWMEAGLLIPSCDELGRMAAKHPEMFEGEFGERFFKRFIPGAPGHRKSGDYYSAPSHEQVVAALAEGAMLHRLAKEYDAIDSWGLIDGLKRTMDKAEVSREGGWPVAQRVDPVYQAMLAWSGERMARRDDWFINPPESGKYVRRGGDFEDECRKRLLELCEVELEARALRAASPEPGDGKARVRRAI